MQVYVDLLRHLIKWLQESKNGLACLLVCSVLTLDIFSVCFVVS